MFNKSFCIVLLAVLLYPAVCLSEQAVSLPFTQTFDTFDYSSEIWLGADCGYGTGAAHTWRNTGEYCFSGGCSDFKGPSDNCGGGDDGGISAYGKVTWYSDEQSVINIRTLVYIGSTYFDDINDEHWQHENKFIDIHNYADVRMGLVCIHQWVDGLDAWGAIGVWSTGDAQVFGPGGANLSNPQFKLDVSTDGLVTTDDANVGQYLCLELQISVPLNQQHLRITNRSGDLLADFTTASQQTSGTIGNMYEGGYWNATMPVERQSNHLILDELSIVGGMTWGTYIGPPAGFVSGEDTTPPTTIISTSDPQKIILDSLTVTGTASDDTAVTGCKWRIGSAPDATHGTACTGTTAWTCSNTNGYTTGDDTLYVGCYDAAGNYGSDSITVTLKIATSFGITANGVSLHN